jgi:hypothetical protein
MRISYKILNNFNINFILNKKTNNVFIRNFTCLNKSQLILNNTVNKKLYLKVNLNNFSSQNDNKNQLVVNNNNNNNNQNNNNDKEEQHKQHQQKKSTEQSPIRKLLRVKDLVDFIFFSFLISGIYIGYKNYKTKKENESKFEMEWLNVPNLKHKLFKCNEYFLPEFLSKNVNNIKNFRMRKDDVWVFRFVLQSLLIFQKLYTFSIFKVVSFPKSGTTWVQEIVYLITNDCDFEKAKSSSIESRSPFIDFPSPGVKYIDGLQSPRIIKTHMPLTFLPDNVQNESKVIYILRNPKDVCVSYYHFAKMSTEAEYTGNFRNFSSSFAEGIGRFIIFFS